MTRSLRGGEAGGAARPTVRTMSALGLMMGRQEASAARATSRRAWAGAAAGPACECALRLGTPNLEAHNGRRWGGGTIAV